MKDPLRLATAGWCVAMALLLVVLQYATGSGMPTFLFVLFTGVWLFGALMLMTFPRFGALGTALYGVILGANVLTMHGMSAVTWAIAIGSFVATALAVAYFLRLRRTGAAAA